jgi:hypothetical protein
MAKGNQKGGSTTKPQRKSAASSKKTKKAKKALGRAKKSVEAAQKAVKSSTKKLRKKVASLSRQSKKLSADHANAVKNAEAAEKKSATAEKKSAETTRPTGGGQSKPGEPTLVVTAAAPASPKSTPARSAKENASLTPPLPTPQPASATLVELRQQAKDKKIPGYYRMNKSDLTAALASAQRK